jgi:hypothetical protein
MWGWKLSIASSFPMACKIKNQACSWFTRVVQALALRIDTQPILDSHEPAGKNHKTLHCTCTGKLFVGSLTRPI